MNEPSFFHWLVLSLGVLEASHTEMLILCMAWPLHTHGTEKLKLFRILWSLNRVFCDKQMNNGPNVTDLIKLLLTHYVYVMCMNTHYVYNTHTHYVHTPCYHTACNHPAPWFVQVFWIFPSMGKPDGELFNTDGDQLIARSSKIGTPAFCFFFAVFLFGFIFDIVL